MLDDKNNQVRALAAGWLLLALAALALSTLCAVLLVAARVPLAGAFSGSVVWFRSALVLHVSLAVIVWFLSCAAGLWTMAAGGAQGSAGSAAGDEVGDVAGPVRWTALALAAGGMAAMVAALFAGATPVLANYVPVLDSPVFLAGLSLFFCGVGLCGIASAGALIRRWRAGPLEIWRLGAALSIAAAAVAAAALIAALALAGVPRDAAGFDALAWGPGHLLQFVHVILLMSAWIVLGEQVLGQAIAPRRHLAGLLLLAAAPLLAAPVIYFNYPVGSPEFRRAFTLLMALGCWPAPALLGLRLLLLFKRAGHAAWRAPLGPALLLSVVLFLLGCVLGSLIRNDSTMVPAHYHGTVGAVTLAYMALGYRLLASFGARAGGAQLRWQPMLYGAGLITLALALAWSGSLGVPRKTLHADVMVQMVQYPAYFVAMGLAGLGGLLAISGAAWFVLNVIGSLRAGRRGAAPRTAARRDVRWPAFALALGLTVALGMLIAYWPGGIDGAASAQGPGPSPGLRKDAAAHVAQKRKEEIGLRFAQGVTLLNQKQYQAAANQWHRVVALAPRMPEAYVNMGFAMIGMKRYSVARDFFNVAIDLNRNQRNAYFGLGVALEGMGDMGGALGAMRSYVHLSQPDDPYLRKANAAIWEWEAALKKQTAANGGNRQASDLPKNEKNVVAYPIRGKTIN
jgi:cytochrome c oxidase subunit I